MTSEGLLYITIFTTQKKKKKVLTSGTIYKINVVLYIVRQKHYFKMNALCPRPQ